jgi:hypothetical protein
LAQATSLSDEESNSVFLQMEKENYHLNQNEMLYQMSRAYPLLSNPSSYLLENHYCLIITLSDGMPKLWTPFERCWILQVGKLKAPGDSPDDIVNATSLSFHREIMSYFARSALD